MPSQPHGACPNRATSLAVDAFRGIALAAGGIHVRSDVPAVFKTNLAVALLMTGNMEGCLSALAEVREEHPAVRKLKAGIQK